MPPSRRSTLALSRADPPRLVTPRFLVLTAAGLAYFAAWTMPYPVLPRFVEDELGGSGVAVGLSVGIFGVTAAVLRPVAGRLGDQRGRRLLVVGGAAIVAVSLLGMVVATSVPAVLGLRLLFGAGEAFAFVGLATAVQDLAPDERRGEAASYFSVSVYLGIAVGPPVGEWLLRDASFDRVWLAAAGLAVVSALLGLATPVGRSEGASESRGWIHPASIRPGLALAGGLFGYAAFVSFAALYADEIDLPGAGYIFTTYAVMILGYRLFGATIPDRYGAVPVARLSLISLGGGLLVIASWPSAVVLYGGVVFLALGMALNFPALLSLVVNRAAPGDRAFAVASISVFFDLAFAGGAIAMGVVVAVGSERWAFAVGGLCALTGLLPLRSARRASRADPAVAA